MKSVFLSLLLIFSLYAEAALSERSVKTINGRAGFLTLSKTDVGLVSPVEAVIGEYVFTAEVTDGTSVDVVTIPANARVVSVGMSTMGNTDCSYSADIGTAEDQNLWGMITPAGATPIYPVADGSSKWTTAKAVKAKFVFGDTSGCADGEKLIGIVQYIQE
jgi:hypothetical protein